MGDVTLVVARLVSANKSDCILNGIARLCIVLL